MNRVRQRCLAASLAIHLSFILLLVFSPGFTNHEEQLQVLQLVNIPLTLTDDGQVRGGIPDPMPPKGELKAKPTIPPPSRSPESVRPKEPETLASPPREVVRNDPPKEISRHEAVPRDTSETTAPPKESPQELSSPEPVPDKSPNKNPDRAQKSMEISKELKKRTPKDDEGDRSTADRAERESRDKARSDAANRIIAERRLIAKNLGQTADSLAHSTGTAMDIQMPGSGGEVFADYRSYLAAFYKQKWNQHKPGGISVKTASALTSVTVGRDGHVRGFKLLEGTGLAEVDKTIQFVLRRYDQLNPFPSSAKDEERTFTLTFRIESDSSP